jgi:hypothetical protein
MRTILLTLLVGCTGPAGQTGATGPTGPTGPMGAMPSPSPSLVRTVVVSPVGTPTQNGTALRTALAGISASATDPWLLKIEPGFYDLGSTALAMKAFVDIEGSGELTTSITATGASTIEAATAQLRFVSVGHTGGGTTVHGDAAASGFSLTHVTLSADGNALSEAIEVGPSGFFEADYLQVFVTGAGTANHIGLNCLGPPGPTCTVRASVIRMVGTGGSGIVTGARTAGGNLILDGVDITVSAGSGNPVGVSIEDGGSSDGSSQLRDLQVETSCMGCALSNALQVLNGTAAADAQVRASSFQAFDGTTKNAVLLQKIGAGAITAEIADSLLGGAVSVSGGATVTCIGNYDAAFAAVTCP